jgi:hypothetical protein
MHVLALGGRHPNYLGGPGLWRAAPSARSPESRADASSAMINVSTSIARSPSQSCPRGRLNVCPADLLPDRAKASVSTTSSVRATEASSALSQAGCSSARIDGVSQHRCPRLAVGHATIKHQGASPSLRTRANEHPEAHRRTARQSPPVPRRPARLGPRLAVEAPCRPARFLKEAPRPAARSSRASGGRTA